ncbi:hypothetical protein IH992_02560 [Candidatus Poribacteria bacterium]|nr:hypothetical protein [Candidatus Poribacteria bacterium]
MPTRPSFSVCEFSDSFHSLWAEMAEDVDYSKHFLAAGAINKLAENLQKQGKPVQAVSYFAQVAIDFRRKNANAAPASVEKVAYQFPVTKISEPRTAMLGSFTVLVTPLVSESVNGRLVISLIVVAATEVAITLGAGAARTIASGATPIGTGRW